MQSPAMGTTDPRVDAYIARSAEFARPILEHMRQVVHAACPDVEETIKWGMPNFMHGGKILAHMAAFKAHCALGFWRREAAGDAAKNGEAMGQLGRIESLKNLPSRAQLSAMVKKAVALIDSGEKPARAAKPVRKPPPVAPDDLAAALKRHAAARKTFEAFAPTHQREYIEWITEAKRPETREKRLAQTLEWLAEGKSRNWKYESC
jgi:uncharacterized protein YdeI (YjbR/CyaY-like superfamily)